MGNFLQSDSPRILEKALDKHVEMRLETSSDVVFSVIFMENS